VRPGPLAVVAVVCALLGGACSLVLAKSLGWVDEGGTQTVVVSPEGAATPAANRVDENAEAKPLAGNDFDPARIYRERAAGVVTLIAVFGPTQSATLPESAQ